MRRFRPWLMHNRSIRRLIIAQCSLVSNPNRLALTDVQSNSFDSKSFLVIPRWITVVGLTNTIASVDAATKGDKWLRRGHR